MIRHIVLFAVLFTPLAGGFAQERRPNVLFAFADDWGRYASIYRQVDGPGSPNDVVKTPTFDRVAREGVLFRHAFVSAPSCTPCRSALLSGQHFWRAGRAAILQGAVWSPSIPSFPLMLRDNGYHIGETYKVWSPGTPADAPFDAPNHSYEQAGRAFNQYSEYVTRAVADGADLAAAKQALHDQVRANFDAFLADRKPGQPFCYWFGPTNVHRMWERGSGKALWGIDPDSLRGKLPPFLPDVPEVREDFADYLGEAQAFDAAVGVLIERLEAIGELDNTLIAISGDHGPPGFTHGKCNLYDFGTSVALAIRWGGAKGGRVVDDLVSLTDLAPTFLEVAGLKALDTMTGRSLVPLLTAERSGKLDPTRTFVLTGRERHVEDARDGYLPYPQRAIRTDDVLYVINFEPDRWPMGAPYRLDGNDVPDHSALVNNTRITLSDMDSGPTKAWLIEHRDDPKWRRFYELAFAKRPREELYDLKKDPFQVHNVAAEAGYEPLRARLHDQLMAELKRTGDPRVVGDGSYFETPPLAGPLPGRPARKKAQSKKTAGTEVRR